VDIMRLWLSGPRIFGFRPGISLRPDEPFEKSKPSRQSQGGFILAVYFGMEDRLRADATFFLACS
jgi:hypothetical protein